jgi:hypothetical protein
LAFRSTCPICGRRVGCFEISARGNFICRGCSTPLTIKDSHGVKNLFDYAMLLLLLMVGFCAVGIGKDEGLVAAGWTIFAIGVAVFYCVIGLSRPFVCTPRTVAPGQFCFKCGYDLRGSPGPNCPECGATILRAPTAPAPETTGDPTEGKKG